MTKIAPTHHLAQLNIAWMRYPLDDPRMADFVAQLEQVNAAADASPGFVWRLDSNIGVGDAPISPFGPNVLVNLSVWENIDALFGYTYGAPHAEVFRQRSDWFEPALAPHLVLWWVPAGHRPDQQEAAARLEHLRSYGSSAKAFTFKTRFPPPKHDPT